MKESSNPPVQGKPWSTHSQHSEYTSALSAKESLSGQSNLQVKIRKYADDTFQVKTRKIGEEVTSPEKRSKKEKPKTRAGRRAEKMRRKSHQENPL